MRIALAIAFAFVLVGYASAQDHVTLKTDGSVLAGAIEGIHLEGVRIRIDAGGAARIVTWGEIAQDGVSMAAPAVLLLSNEDRVSGTLRGFDGAALLIDSALIANVRVPVSALAPAPAAPEPSEEELAEAADKVETLLEPKDWSGKIALLGAFRTGNVDTTLFTLTASVTRQWAEDRFLAEAAFAYGETEGETTASSAIGRAKWDHFYTKDFYSYGMVEAEWDDIKNLDIRALLGIGTGYNIWRGKKEHQSFDVEGGATFYYESYSGESGDVRIAARVAVAYMNRFFEDLLFTQRVEFLMPIPEVGEYLLRSLTSFEVAVSESWFLKNLIEIEYQGDPPDNTESFDMKVLLGLEYKF